MVNDPSYPQDFTDNGAIHVQTNLSDNNSNIMVNQHANQIKNGTTSTTSMMNNAPAPLATTTTTTQIETIYTNQKSNYDIAYGTAGQVDLQVPHLIQTQPTQMLCNPAHQTMNTINEPVYGINRLGAIAFIGQQPTTSSGINVHGNLGEVRWRDPQLEEVIEFLSSPDPMVRASSVAYLQHLSYADDVIKQRVRLLGGIAILVDLLNRDMIEVKRNVCGALRNLSYGKKNDDNKRAIRDAQGIQALVRTLAENPDNEIRESATSVLWNMSSCEDVKWSIVEEALDLLVSVILIPYTNWFKSNIGHSQQFLPTVSETHWSTVFRNSTGILRNISSAGVHARKQMRECQGLIESLFYIINSSISRNDVENKLVENCVCILRNLSYKCQETQDPDYDKHSYNHSLTDSTPNSMQNSPSSPTSSANFSTSLMGHVSSKVTDNLGCFGFKKRSRSKSKSRSGLLSGSSTKNNSSIDNSEQTSASPNDSRPSALLPPHHPSNLQMNGTNQSGKIMRTSTQIGNSAQSNATLPRAGISNIPSNVNSTTSGGQNLLWHTDVVKPYLALLSGCSNSETLEAAAGAIQNLAACYWQPSVEIRAAVRKERGLPVLVELLRMDRDQVVCVVATALRNLAIDQKNKELIGKYAMPDLVNKLTTGLNNQECPSDDTIAAVLATLHEVISNNVDFVRSLYEAGGLNKLTFLVRNKTRYSSRVQRFAAQVSLLSKFTRYHSRFSKFYPNIYSIPLRI